MSTIHHSVHHHAGLYLTAAAIVLAGLLAALVAAVFWPSHASDVPRPALTVENSSVQPYHGQLLHPVCFAQRHGEKTIELGRAGCSGAR